MKIGLILEGSYPYVSGGVSSWTQMLITNLPDYQFEIIAILDKPKTACDYKYKLPPNVSGIHNVVITEATTSSVKKPKHHNTNLNDKEILLIQKWMLFNEVDHHTLLLLGNEKKMGSTDSFLQSKIFWNLVQETYNSNKESGPFLEFFHMWSSMIRQLTSILTYPFPKVDIVHSASTGYGGIVAAFMKQKYDIPFILTEHGIYAREREEEVLQSTWIPEHFKIHWINYYYHLSKQSYRDADEIITLFEKNSQLQHLLGAPKAKLKVIPNGINFDEYKTIVTKKSSNKLMIGAIVRVVPIKDIKTMIHSARILKDHHIDFELIIMGPKDENPQYAEECEGLINSLDLSCEVSMVGKVNIMEYLPQFDVMVLSSISEGQPLAVLEGMAAGLPCIVTNVGGCSELIHGGKDDESGPAGFVISPVSPNQLAEKLLEISEKPSMRYEMSVNGRKRVEANYQLRMVVLKYTSIYNYWGKEETAYGGNRLPIKKTI